VVLGRSSVPARSAVEQHDRTKRRKADAAMGVRRAHRPVVVGVDGSSSAYRAVEWAAAEAARRGVGLRLVRAFSWTTADQPTGWVVEYRDQLLEVSRRQVARAARIAADTRPDVEADPQVEIGAPIEVLGAEARGGAAGGAR
jgi:nucleotide-binding universal stress UspA family protein